MDKIDTPTAQIDRSIRLNRAVDLIKTTVLFQKKERSIGTNRPLLFRHIPIVIRMVMGHLPGLQKDFQPVEYNRVPVLGLLRKKHLL